MDCRELAACVRSFAAPQRGGRCKNVDMGVLLIGFGSRRGNRRPHAGAIPVTDGGVVSRRVRAATGQEK